MMRRRYRWQWKGLFVAAFGAVLLAVACQGPGAAPGAAGTPAAKDSPAAVDLLPAHNAPTIGPPQGEEVMGHSPLAHHVPFETIERVERNTGNQAAERWQSPAPGVAVIGRREEVETLGEMVSAEALAQLRALDYGENFALVVFLGHRPNVEEIVIEHVLDWGEQLSLKGHVPVYEDSLPAKSSPYHIISLEGEWVWREPLRFDLWIDGTHAVVGQYPSVVSQTTPVPTATSPYTPTATATPTQTATPWTTFTPPAPGTPWPPGYPPPGATPYENSTLTPYPAPQPTSMTPVRVVD